MNHTLKAVQCQSYLYSPKETVSWLNCLYDLNKPLNNNPRDALLLGHRVQVLVETRQVHFDARGSTAGNRDGAICYLLQTGSRW